MSEKNDFGKLTWFDLTVPDAENIRDFYSEVIGWKPEEVKMGDYSDYNMTDPESGDPVTGICHAKGVNASLPPQWMIYVTVENIELSLEKCLAKGGKKLSEIREMKGYGRYCAIQDPAGAVLSLYETE